MREIPAVNPPLQFIEELYSKRFGKTSPEAVLSIEERCRREAAKKEERRMARAKLRTLVCGRLHSAIPDPIVTGA